MYIKCYEDDDDYADYDQRMVLRILSVMMMMMMITLIMTKG